MNRMELEYYSRRYGLFVILGLAVVAFLIPFILRALQGAPITPGAQSYTYLRHAQLLENGLWGYDPVRAVQIAPDPYTVLLAAMMVFGVPWLLPLLLAVLCMLLLYYVLERFIPMRAIVVISLVVLALSPTMSVLATQHTGVLLALDLLLAAFLLSHRPIVASVLICLALITAPVLALILVLYIAAVYLRDARHHEVIGIMIAIAVASAWFMVWTGTLPFELSAIRIDTNLFFELGNPAGITLFAVILACYAVVLKFGKLQGIIMPSLLLFFFTFFLPALLPVTAIVVSVFAGHAIFLLLTNRWELELLRESLLILVMCIGIFLLITTVRERAAEGPTPEFSHTMLSLRNQFRPGAVLTDPAYAPMVEYFSGRQATLHDEIPEPAFYSRDPTIVYPFLVDTGTAYLLVTKEMEQKRFSSSEQGILFLAKNSGRFVRLEETADGTLYYFIRT